MSLSSFLPGQFPPGSPLSYTDSTYRWLVEIPGQILVAWYTIYTVIEKPAPISIIGDTCHFFQQRIPQCTTIFSNQISLRRASTLHHQTCCSFTVSEARPKAILPGNCPLCASATA